MPKHQKKHPKDMTTEEAIKHLFPLKVVKQLKHAASESGTSKRNTGK